MRIHIQTKNETKTDCEPVISLSSDLADSILEVLGLDDSGGAGNDAIEAFSMSSSSAEADDPSDENARTNFAGKTVPLSQVVLLLSCCALLSRCAHAKCACIMRMRMRMHAYPRTLPQARACALGCLS